MASPGIDLVNKKNGHRAVICKSKKKISNFTSAAFIATSSLPLKQVTITIPLNNVPTDALMATRSPETFISNRFAETCCFKVYCQQCWCCCGLNVLQFTNYCVVNLELMSHQCENAKLNILSNLCNNVFVDHDLLKQHSELNFFWRFQTPSKVCYLVPATIESLHFRIP